MVLQKLPAARMVGMPWVGLRSNGDPPSPEIRRGRGVGTGNQNGGQHVIRDFRKKISGIAKKRIPHRERAEG